MKIKFFSFTFLVTFKILEVFSTPLPISLTPGSHEIAKDGYIILENTTSFSYFSNPALLSLKPITDYAFSFRKEFLDISSYSVSLRKEIKDYPTGTIILFRDYGFIENITSSEGLKGTFHPYDLFLCSGISKRINNLSFGFSYKFLLRRIKEKTYLGNFFSLGSIYSSNKNGVSFSINNLPEIEFLETRTGISFLLSSIVLTFGATYRNFNKLLTFLIAFEGKYENIGFYTGIGDEYTSIGFSIPFGQVLLQYSFRTHPVQDFHTITIGMK